MPKDRRHVKQAGAGPQHVPELMGGIGASGGEAAIVERGRIFEAGVDEFGQITEPVPPRFYGRRRSEEVAGIAALFGSNVPDVSDALRRRWALDVLDNGWSLGRVEMAGGLLDTNQYFNREYLGTLNLVLGSYYYGDVSSGVALPMALDVDPSTHDRRFYLDLSHPVNSYDRVMAYMDWLFIHEHEHVHEAVYTFGMSTRELRENWREVAKGKTTSHLIDTRPEKVSVSACTPVYTSFPRISFPRGMQGVLESIAEAAGVGVDPLMGFIVGSYRDIHADSCALRLGGILLSKLLSLEENEGGLSGKGKILLECYRGTRRNLLPPSTVFDFIRLARFRAVCDGMQGFARGLELEEEKYIRESAAGFPAETVGEAAELLAREFDRSMERLAAGTADGMDDPQFKLYSMLSGSFSRYLRACLRERINPESRIHYYAFRYEGRGLWPAERGPRPPHM